MTVNLHNKEIRRVCMGKKCIELEAKLGVMFQ